MKKLFVIAAMTSVLTVPAFAQEFSPEVTNDHVSTAGSDANSGSPSALAEPESGWSTFDYVRYNGESYFADLGATRANGVAALESMVSFMWQNSSGFSVTGDIWNMHAIENRDASACAVDETDYELTFRQANLIGQAAGRVKLADYALCGGHIYSALGAMDYPLFGPFSASTSIEAMGGSAELVVVKPFAPSVTLTLNDFTFYGDIAPAYNTLDGEWNAPWIGRISHPFGPFTAAVIARGYLGDDSDATAAFQVGYAHQF